MPKHNDVNAPVVLSGDTHSGYRGSDERHSQSPSTEHHRPDAAPAQSQGSEGNFSSPKKPPPPMSDGASGDVLVSRTSYGSADGSGDLSQRRPNNADYSSGAGGAGGAGGGERWGQDPSGSIDAGASKETLFGYPLPILSSKLAFVLKWALAGLLLLFLGAIVFGVYYSGVRYAAVGRNCATPFGTILGIGDGVPAYSNCNDAYVSSTTHSLRLPVGTGEGADHKHPGGGAEGGPGPAADGQREVFMGLEWQCVEYARRYWALRGRPFPAVFGDVDGAADMWGLRSVAAVADPGRRAALARHPNGGAVPPAAGDLLIYPRAGQERDFPYGHVAAVVWVGAAAVRVAEQNWDSRPWPPPFHNYSREIPMRVTRGGAEGAGDATYTLEDPGGKIQGWLRYGSEPYEGEENPTAVDAAAMVSATPLTTVLLLTVFVCLAVSFASGNVAPATVPFSVSF